MAVIMADELRKQVTEILCAADVPEKVSRQVAHSLVESNLVGHDSHGVMRVPAYVRGIQAGTLKPTGEIRAVRESAATARLDCGHTFGQVALRQGMELAIAKARQHDVATVVLGNCDHTGRIGEYVVMAAEQGFMGLAISNGSVPGGIGGAVRRREKGAGREPTGLGHTRRHG